MTQYDFDLTKVVEMDCDETIELNYDKTHDIFLITSNTHTLLDDGVEPVSVTLKLERSELEFLRDNIEELLYESQNRN